MAGAAAARRARHTYTFKFTFTSVAYVRFVGQGVASTSRRPRRGPAVGELRRRPRLRASRPSRRRAIYQGALDDGHFVNRRAERPVAAFCARPRRLAGMVATVQIA